MIRTSIDLEISALTGGRSGLEPALIQFQVDLCLSRGEIYVAGQGNNIEGVLLAYAPGQDFLERQDDQPRDYATRLTSISFSHAASSPLCAEYISKLSPEMQQWWTSHVRSLP